MNRRTQCPSSTLSAASAVALFLAVGLAAVPALANEPYFTIRVVDADTDRGVPLVELRTTNDARYVTDSAGLIVFHEPGLMGQRVFFHIKSHGYHFPSDAFGAEGRALPVKAGGEATLEVERENIAERLYRVTGQGIYDHSVRLGEPVPIREPVLNAQVMGQDSVHTAVYRGRIHWFWGDTSRPGHPLGNFKTSGATSRLPEDGGLGPAEGVDLDYFTNDDGFTRQMAPLPADDGGNLVWIDGVTTVADGDGGERLIARYTRLRSLSEPVEQGLLVFDDDAERFEHVVTIDLDEPWRRPSGQAARYRDGDREYLLFGRPWPLARVPASFEAVRDPARYEAFTPLAPGAEFDGPDTELQRDDAATSSGAGRPMPRRSRSNRSTNSSRPA